VGAAALVGEVDAVRADAVALLGAPARFEERRDGEKQRELEVAGETAQAP
jgi:hypothetical protein